MICFITDSSLSRQNENGTALRVTVCDDLYWRASSDGTEQEIKKHREAAASVSVALKTTTNS